MNNVPDSLDLRALHDQVHALILSRRRDVGFWEGPFETAWVGYVFSRHAPENQSPSVLNSIKGELLGDRRIQSIAKPYDLAACFMAAAFLQRAGSADGSREYIQMANAFVDTLVGQTDWDDRFHFYSTPDYVYAAAIVARQDSAALSSIARAALDRSLDQFAGSGWHANPYVFALVGTALLWLRDLSEAACLDIARFADQLMDSADESGLATLWFLEENWETLRSRIDSAEEFVAMMDSKFIEYRTRMIRTFPSFSLEPSFDLSLPESQRLEHVAEERIVSTIDLLMLDEVAEKHSISSLVLTRAELLRRDAIVTVFDNYRSRVDAALNALGLGPALAAIYDNLSSENPASWGLAVLGCRNVLYALAEKLLQVPDQIYPHLPDKTGKQLMSLAKDKQKNRFLAYLHQLGHWNGNELVKAHLEYLDSLLRNLMNELSDKGKRSSLPTYADASACVLNTYLFLGELERLTSFVIITEIKK
jgi:hypothetical protein